MPPCRAAPPVIRLPDLREFPLSGIPSAHPFPPSPLLPHPESRPRIVLTPDPEVRLPFLNAALQDASPPLSAPPLFIGAGQPSPESIPPEPRIADIFRAEGDRLLNSGKLSPEQGKAVFSIINCRTEVYGYHADVCDACGFVEAAYNSCGNRHCPQCQGTAKKRWVNARLDELLPVPHHHAVFTVPSYISMLSLYNQKLIYDLLFFAAAQTLLLFGRDKKFLGTEIGFYGILHTWSQTLGPHIHIHFIVTAGGLTAEGKWKEAKHGKKFLFPVRALSEVFRGKFIEGLKKHYYSGQLTVPSDMKELNTPEGFEKQLDVLVKKSWRVYSKPPFSGPEEVVRYIGRYSHRTAISDSRILSFENGQVTFSYKDNKEKDPGKKYKEMTLTSGEFVRRFLYHILPNRYHRIRNFGFLSNGRKLQNIEIIRKQLPDPGPAEAAAPGDDAAVCPVCGKGRMRTFLNVDGFGRITEYNPSVLYGGYPDTS